MQMLSCDKLLEWLFSVMIQVTKSKLRETTEHATCMFSGHQGVYKKQIIGVGGLSHREENVLGV